MATTQAKPETMAIAKVELPKHPLATIDDLGKTFQALSGRANLVSPVATVDSIPAMHAISIRAVMIDAGGSEVYNDSKFCGKDEVALGGVALQKIAAAAGVQMLGTRRIDDRSDPHYCAMEVTIGMRDFDGTWRQVNKGKEIDLRKGSAEASRMTEGNLGNARKHIQSLCETKAFYRALRTLLTLKQKYNKAELARPFVVPKLVPALDPNDPDQKRALIGMALGGEQRLFGAGPKDETTTALQDVTPAALPPPPITPPVKPPAVGTVAPDDEEDDEPAAPQNDAEDFDMLEPAPAEEAAIIVCLCPCGDQREITEQSAKMSTEKVGTPRCSACFPGGKFDFQAHKDLKDLGYKKGPYKTADDIQKALAARAAGK